MPTPEIPEAVPNPYAERPLDDDSAGALAALLFDSPSDKDNGSTAPDAPVAGSKPAPTPLAVDPEVVEATGTLFAPVDPLDDGDVFGAPAPNQGRLFRGESPVDPDQPASLRWSRVVHEPTVAEMGSRSATSGRHLFLEDAAATDSPPRLYVPPPDRSAFSELVERRWHWFAVAGVAGLLIGFVAFTIGTGGGDTKIRFPDSQAQAADQEAESVADTVPGGPALAANDEGNTGSFKGASTATSASVVAAPRRTGTTVPTPSISSSTSDPSTSSTSSTASTTTTVLTTSTLVPTTTTIRPTTSRPVTTTTSRPTTTTRQTTTTRPTTTTTRPTTTSRPTTTAVSTTTTVSTTSGSSSTTDPSSTTTDTTASTTASSVSTTEGTPTSQDDPGPDPSPLSTTTSASTTTTGGSGGPGIVVASEDPPNRSNSTIF